MADKKQDDSSFGVAVFALLVACFAVGVSFCAIASQANPTDPCECQPAPTPAACCKADDCKQELARVDARFGDVWDELVEVQEQLAKVSGCCELPLPKSLDDGSILLPRYDNGELVWDQVYTCKCEPSKPCACSDKPACECKPAEKPAVNSQVPVRRVFKRCK